jgi:peptide/nickel transport system substrate-binding protein
MTERNYWQRMKQRPLSRRSLLRASARAGVGAAGLALVGCGGDDDDDDGQAQPAATQVEQQEQAAEQQAQQQDQQEAQDQAAVAEAQQQQQTDGIQRGGTWRISDAFAPQWGFDPLVTPSGGDHYQSIPIFYDRLLNYDEQGAALPMLAESWEIPDDVTYVFSLRPGLTYHDGAKLDAASVQTNMDRIVGIREESVEATPNQRAVTLGDTMANSEAIDEVTWRYVANEVFAPTLSLFYGKPPGMAPTSPESFDTAITNPVGAGPFVFDKYIEGDELTATKFQDYWNAENIHLDNYSFQILPDANTQWVAFLSGDHDVVRVPGSLAADADQMADIEDDGFQVLGDVSSVFIQTWYNVNPTGRPELAIWRDPRMRHAVNLATDRHAINDAAFNGTGAASRAPIGVTTPLLPVEDDFYADSPNPAEAVKLIDAAGYTGKVTGDMMTYSIDPLFLGTRPMHAQLAEVGMDFNLVEGTIAGIVDRLFAADDYSIAVLSWESPFDPDQIMRPSMDGLRDWFYTGGREEYDALLASGSDCEVGLEEASRLQDLTARSTDVEERIARYRTFHEFFVEGAYTMPIIHYPLNYGFSPSVRHTDAIERLFRGCDGIGGTADMLAGVWKAQT